MYKTYESLNVLWTSMDIMVTKNILLVIFKFLLFNLECWVIDSLSPTNICKAFQNLSLLTFFWKHVSYQNCFSWTQIPDMEIMNVNYSLDFAELLSDLVRFYIVRCWFHYNKVTILKDRLRWDKHNCGKDVCGYRVAVMPVIPFSNFCPHIRTSKENYQWAYQKSNTLNNIS